MSYINYLLRLKRSHQNVIYNLQEIIETNEKNIQFINTNTMDDIKKNTIRTCENTSSVCTKMLNDYEMYLIQLNTRIQENCCHEFVYDLIDIMPDRSMHICYCKICEYTDC